MPFHLPAQRPKLRLERRAIRGRLAHLRGPSRLPQTRDVTRCPDLLPRGTARALFFLLPSPVSTPAALQPWIYDLRVALLIDLCVDLLGGKGVLRECVVVLYRYCTDVSLCKRTSGSACLFCSSRSFVSSLFSFLLPSSIPFRTQYLLPLPPDHPCDVTVVDTRVDDALHERACETTTLGGKSGKKNVSEPVYYESPALTCRDIMSW